MKLKDVMTALAAKGREKTKLMMLKHGAKEPLFGVQVADLKVIAKSLKGRQDLALELFDTGNADAQYLAGMIADGRHMTKAQLDRWAKTASWDWVSATAAPWAASEHPEGFALAMKWIESKSEPVARAGWRTLGALGTMRPDADLPVAKFGQLLDRVVREMPRAPDGVRYQMNFFVIAVGTYVEPLGARAIATARKLGKVEMEEDDTDCQVPDAESYIIKCRRGLPVAPKRKTVRC
ncbi:DNA alkylation repair enzyme [Lacunisphaera limnophila]|uniref:DNA alkylation repair enzyme n=1 Tax=Lacunisphaera limnophila TaxID=1838286 RepID=A0A1D8AYF8_9BACT|nr:DNA alkylation repair protein [Lacunisphaera limnophila]AOS45926.1 DNA alkylation repair enzyme [Lacunisphaera limnophila]